MVPRVPNQAALTSHPFQGRRRHHILPPHLRRIPGKRTHAQVTTGVGRRREQKCARQRVSAPCCHSKDGITSDFIKGPVFVWCLSRRVSCWISCTLDCQPIVFSVAHKEFYDLFVCGGREMIKLCLSGFNSSSATEWDGAAVIAGGSRARGELPL